MIGGLHKVKVDGDHSDAGDYYTIADGLKTYPGMQPTTSVAKSSGS